MKTLKQLLRLLARLFGLGVTEPVDPLTNLADRIETRTELEILPLPESQRRILDDISNHARDSRSKRGSQTTVLFTGVNSCEKTNAARMVARDLDRNLYRVDTNRVISKYIGETEKNLNQIFKAADAAGAILFFDEADALFGKRSEVKDSHDRYANIEIGYLLQQLEAFHGVAILATNNEENIDDTFRRRIRFVVELPPP